MSIAQQLEDLPSDAFSSSFASSPEKSPNRVAQDEDVLFISSQVSPSKVAGLVAPRRNLKQLTLFGDAAQKISTASQATKRHNFPLANHVEKPTHHKLNEDALRTWVYPTNLGTIRDYQFNIVARGLFHNLLVALPTGLGKTFIAATIMLNWFRWTKDAQIVFVAPTRPLVSQQVEACFGIAGIPRSQTTMLTGGISPGLRAEEWANKRVFFMTPQTIVNDLKTGICDPKRIVLLVVDEAHRATGGYAYVEVVKFLKRFNESFRVLALTATPGGSVESVQEVVDGLQIARVEIRTEFSLDIRQYVHSRKTETILFENSEEMEMVSEMFSKAVQPVLNKLNSVNAYWSRDPMQLTAYGLTMARQRWVASPAGRNANFGVKGMVNRLFTVLASLAHSVELLKYHGIGPFYHGMVNFRNTREGSKGGGGKYEKEIMESEHFLQMMTRLYMWMNNATFIGHPKLDYLQGIVLDHFLGAGTNHGTSNTEPPSATRIMIFAHYRDSAEEIVRVLKRNEPMIRPHVFVGQAASKGSEGMDQKRQLEILQDYKKGKYNTLVATSIGEEGLDIGEIDLIICYDSSASPIRMLQRMGRTGRKRAGNIILLLMKGKEENSFAQAKDNYEKMQQMIAAGARFTFHEEASPRIVPRDIQPVVDKCVVEIPIENTQGDLPEPKKGRGKAPKRPPKKFHMPDGVRTGFVKASRMDAEDEYESEQHVNGPEQDSNPRKRPRQHEPPLELEPVPTLQDVLLTRQQEQELQRKYRDSRGASQDDITIERPRLDRHPARQRVLGATAYVKHGTTTASTTKTLKAMHAVDQNTVDVYRLRGSTASLDATYSRSTHRLVADHAVETVEHDSEEDELPPIPPPQKRKPGRPAKTTKSKPAAAQPRKRKRPADRDEDEDVAMEAAPSSAPATSPRMQMLSQGISLGGSDTSGEDEEEELDSELRDFVVEDEDGNVDEEDIGDTLTSSVPYEGGGARKTPASSAPFYKPQKLFTSSRDEDDDEDELEDVATLLRKPRSTTANRTTRERDVNGV